MRIAGLEKVSFVDYPGLLAAVVFTPGCNLDCYFCHNRALIARDTPAAWLEVEVAMAWLDERREVLDAVVISGGEPTLQPGLPDFIRAVRAKGYRIKLDTNGTQPAALAALLHENLLDYVAMDVKAPRDRYAEVCGAPVDPEALDASIALLLQGAVDYEFRTTVLPQLDETDVVAIAEWVCGARRYVLQQFRRPREAGTFADLRNAAPPHAPAWIEEVLPRIQPFVQSCGTRGFDAAERRAVPDRVSAFSS